MNKKPDTKINDYCTHLSESSEHMASHRFSEEVFLRMPLKAFGGWGKFGKWKSLISTSLILWTLASDCNKDSTVSPVHDSVPIANILLVKY